MNEEDRDSTSEEADQSRRTKLVRRAVKKWREQLLDFGGRNSLLNYRDLRAGTLDLKKADPAARTTLVGGRAVKLSRLFSEEEAFADALKRARTIRKKTVEHFEERGIETLFLGFGLATWERGLGKPPPKAPVLLRPAILQPRGAAQDDFDLVLAGDMEVNSTLLQLLARDFGVKPDVSALEVEGAIDTVQELNEALRWMSAAASSVPGFSTTPRMVLGNFAYMKLPMVRDLEEGEENLLESDLVAALAGDEQARESIRERSQPGEVSLADPDHTPPSDEFLVLDADASQNYAVNSAVAGHDVIIKGPPGTGKSQTIANLIACLAARGKRTLFVAEKRAAIEAVLKRLGAVGLSDLVFDLHGGIAGRRQVAQTLATSLQATRQIPAPNGQDVAERLERRRSELTSRAEALHERREPWGISVYQAQVGVMATPDEALSDFRMTDQPLHNLDADSFVSQVESLAAYAGLGGLTQDSSSRAWSGAIVTSTEEAQAALRGVQRLSRETVPGVIRMIYAAADETQLTLPESVGEWSEVINLWEEISTTSEVLETGVYDEGPPTLLEALAPLGRSALYRWMKSLSSGGYRRAKKTTRSHAVNRKVRNSALYAAVATAQRAAEGWARYGVPGTYPTSPSTLQATRAAYDQLRTELAALAKYLPTHAFEERTVLDLQRTLKALLDDRATLTKLPELHRLHQSLTAAGLQDLVAEMRERQLSPELSQACLRYVWFCSILDDVALTDPAIGAFDGQNHSRTVSEFQDADREHLETTPARVLRRWAEQVVTARNANSQESALLLIESRKKRKLLPFRELFSETQDLLLDLKPCWVMSPLVVSQLLPNRKLFDVLIFDEASQIRPADAIPAIARAERVVIAGDSRQLPPTAFFLTSSDDEDGDADSEEDVSTQLAAVEGFESILDTLEPLLPFRMLEWHYRSEDERLIAFSNSHFYDRSLTTFPGSGRDLPITHVLVPFRATAPGQENTSSDEVSAVVDRIIEHAENRPEQSLGVIAMGIKHANRIEEALRAVLHERADLEDFFSEAQPERFFIKNLERVQGDERDAILLSVGYGKSFDGRMLYRFGPINNEGGERRLNVAVTRARRHLSLISSFSSADMDPERLRSEGARLLRSYLQYAESGCTNLGEHILEKPALNAFEIDVRDSLLRNKIPVVAQLGVSGFWIDFAAKHPRKRGRYALAIECDGATYHSTPTARDRDRLRQEQLERLGWRFHRIWSTDWFYNKEESLSRVMEAYQEAVSAMDRETKTKNKANKQPDDEDPGEIVETSSKALLNGGGTARNTHPSFQPGLKITDYSHDKLVSVVRWIESDTLLRTDEELLEETMREMGFRRRGKNITIAITDAIQHAHGQREGPSGASPFLQWPPSRPRRSKSWSHTSRYRRRYRRW